MSGGQSTRTDCPGRSWWQIFADFGPQAQAAFIGASFALHGLVGIVLSAISLAVGNGIGMIAPLIYIVPAYIVGLPIALLVGWPFATTLERFGLRSWSWYLIGGAALGAAAFGWFGFDLLFLLGIEDRADPFLIAAAYGASYAALFRYGLFDRLSPY